jgi:hypothetical protein
MRAPAAGGTPARPSKQQPNRRVWRAPRLPFPDTSSHDVVALIPPREGCRSRPARRRTPPVRHLRDRPPRRARRPVSGRSDVLLFRRRRSGCLLDFRLTPAAGFVRPCRWPDDRISRKRSPRGQRALRRRSSCAASRRTGSGAGRALGRRCYRRPRDGRRQRSDRPLR